MLPKTNRIPRKDLKPIVESGRIYRSPALSLRLLFVSGGPSRFSFSVSKKNLKLAVDRNKLRRRGYAVLKGLWPRVKPGFSGLFSVNRGAKLGDYEVIRSETEALLRKAGVIGN